MPPLDPDAPWWVNVILGAIAMVVITGGSVWVAQIQTRRRLADTQVAVAQTQNAVAHTQSVVSEVRDQVSNTHSTNLRADLDLQAEAIHRVERHVSDVSESVRAIERSLDRRYRIQSQELSEAVEDRKRAIENLGGEISDQVERVLQEHVNQYHPKEGKQ